MLIRFEFEKVQDFLILKNLELDSCVAYDENMSYLSLLSDVKIPYSYDKIKIELAPFVELSKFVNKASKKTKAVNVIEIDFVSRRVTLSYDGRVTSDLPIEIIMDGEYLDERKLLYRRVEDRLPNRYITVVRMDIWEDKE